MKRDDRVEVLRWNPDQPIEEPYMSLSQITEEDDVSKQIVTEVKVTDEELMIAARIVITREQLLNQKAMDQLEPDELLLLRAGLTPVQILAKRSVR